MIVTSKRGITLVGGGKVRRSTLEACLGHAPTVVAADGGAAQALKRGITPRATIGDLDSLSAADATRLPPGSIHEITEQDSTDFEKVLRSCEAPFFLAAGFLGRRMDHGLAVLSALARHHGPPCIVVGEHDLVFALPTDVSLYLPIGTRMSLFPMQPVTGRSEGLEWPAAGIPFAPGGRIGTSNRASDNQIRLEMDGPGMLCLLPPDHLQNVLEALGLTR